MNEHETNLIREYVIISYLIKETINELEHLKTARIALKGLLVVAAKASGSRLRDKLRDVQKDLRNCGIHVFIEDDGTEVIYVGTLKNRVKGRFGIKRGVLREDMEKRLHELSGEFMYEDNSPFKFDASFGDPYAKLHKN